LIKDMNPEGVTRLIMNHWVETAAGRY